MEAHGRSSVSLNRFLGAFVLTDFGHELSYLQSELGFEIGMLGSTVWWRGWYA